PGRRSVQGQRSCDSNAVEIQHSPGFIRLQRILPNLQRSQRSGAKSSNALQRQELPKL
ncbi:MAG: hypothetical protein RL737_391, partial [Bacteroidota bacterium]